MPATNENDGKVPKRSAVADLILFYKYFHGDNREIGANLQTGWDGDRRVID